MGAETPHTHQPRNDNLALTLSVCQFRQLVADAVAEALEQHDSGRPPAPEFVDHAAICSILSVSRTTLHRLRGKGLPCVSLGDTFRYRVADVIAWLESGEAAK